MIEKAIENWLINTNETNYRTAFCQVLLNKCHTVKNMHGPLEDGKDVISTDKNGNYFAFQLKGGNINTSAFGEIKPQIDELIEIDIKHPSFDAKKPHESFLVTNGLIDSFANRKINEYNDSKARRGYGKLKTIDKDDLLKMFIDSQGKFIPKEFDDFYLFLDLLTTDGKNFLPKAQFLNFLDHICFNKIPTRKSDKINAISSSLILVSYLLDPFQKENNYHALFEAWTCLGASVIRFAKISGLSEGYWKDSLDLIISEIERNLYLLKNEILSRTTFFEGSPIGENKITYNSRILVVLGVLAALEIHLSKSDDTYKFDNDLLDLIKRNIDNLFFWGESAFPYYFNLIKYLEMNGEEKLASNLLKKILKKIVTRNQPRNEFGVPNPYYDVNPSLEGILRLELELKTIYSIVKEILNIDTTKNFEEVLLEILNVGKNPNSIDKMFKEVLIKSNLKKIDFNQFCGSSYVLESLILMLVRRNERLFLEKNWHDLSYIYFETFDFDKEEDLFFWLTPNGKTHAELPETPTKWSNLVKKADDKSLKPFYVDNTAFLHFFIMVYPHRANRLLINFLDTF